MGAPACFTTSTNGTAMQVVPSVFVFASPLAAVSKAVLPLVTSTR